MKPRTWPGTIITVLAVCSARQAGAQAVPDTAGLARPVGTARVDALRHSSKTAAAEAEIPVDAAALKGCC